MLIFVGWQEARYSSNVSTNFRHVTLDSLTSPAQGFYNTFGAGGYVVSLGHSQEEAKVTIKSLQNNDWLDALTRGVIVEFAVYNANTNLFTVAKIIIETPATGGIFLKRFVESFKPYPYVEPWDFILLVLQLVWVVLIIYYLVITVSTMRKERWSYIRGFWNWVQFGIVVMCLTAIVMAILRITSIIKAVEDMKNFRGKYVNLSYNTTIYKYFRVEHKFGR